MTKTYLATTATGVEVYIGEDTLKHLEAHSDVKLEDVAEAIKAFDYVSPFRIGMVDLGRVVGKNNCVEVSDGDKVLHLHRKGRQGTTPIVFSKEAADTSIVTVGVCKDDDGKDTLFTSYYGVLAPKEPWDRHLKDEERPEAEEFWSTHAIVYNPELIEPEDVAVVNGKEVM